MVGARVLYMDRECTLQDLQAYLGCRRTRTLAHSAVELGRNQRMGFASVWHHWSANPLVRLVHEHNSLTLFPDDTGIAWTVSALGRWIAPELADLVVDFCGMRFQGQLAEVTPRFWELAAL